MKLVPPEPQVDLYNEGFEETDILQRRKTGEALSDLLNRIDDPLVVALDGRWGTGKTHFLKRWVGAHEGATTIYFDAFAHDYLGDPLPNLIAAELDCRIGGKGANLEKRQTRGFKEGCCQAGETGDACRLGRCHLWRHGKSGRSC